ncbi:hypothetical protein B0A50_02002 [Salinomyces thailandicus]|uniref:C2H2-type domain-containing protein n=1 Tax=Salinomyces thailandicus TaxID=706561 RepID=A0A4U0U7L3_9PEZI|nr:hypothetical protein B0A50_02002 [Salinomyces thailandica]
MSKAFAAELPYHFAPATRSSCSNQVRLPMEPSTKHATKTSDHSALCALNGGNSFERQGTSSAIVSSVAGSQSPQDLAHESELLKCQTCGKGCAEQKSLNTHIRTIHGIQTLQECQYCGRAFRRHDSLLRHEREQHTTPTSVRCRRCGSEVVAQGMRYHWATKLCQQEQQRQQMLRLEKYASIAKPRVSGSDVSVLPSIDPLLVIWKLCDALVPRTGWKWRREFGMKTRTMDTFVSPAPLIKRLESYDETIRVVQLAFSRHDRFHQKVERAANLYASIMLLTLMEGCVSGQRNIAFHVAELSRLREGPFAEVERLGLRLLDDFVQDEECLDFPRLGDDDLHTRIIGNDAPAYLLEENAPGVHAQIDPRFERVVIKVGRASWEQIVRVR